MADPDLVRWAREATKGEKDSAVFLTLFDVDMKEDPTPVLQLGYAMFLDKPILILAPRGAAIPDNMRKVARAIAFYDRDDKESLQAATLELLAEFKGPS